MCQHLVDAVGTGGTEYVRLLTGHGIEADLCCRTCDKAKQEGAQLALVEVCEGCLALYADDAHGYLVGWRGEPGIAERPEPLDPALTTTPLPAGIDSVVDLAAVATATDRSVWLALTDDGRLIRFDADAGPGPGEEVATTTVPTEPDHQPWAGNTLRRRLHLAPDGRFAAIVNDFGQHGQVIDLDTGSVTLTLNGGDYHPDTVPFSVAFADDNGRTVVVHRTAWNRLDVSDPASGQLLTPRQPESYQLGEPLPGHYLDYFHGALRASPSGRWLADDGWVWHPVGIPAVWDLHRWLQANVWESEDGPTRRDLCYRDYHWNAPICWIGDNLVAVSGIGSDDLAILPGVRVFDVSTGVELHAFPGPRGALFSAGQRLYAAAPNGLEIWDPFTGHRTGRIPAFVPTHHHSTAGELVAIQAGELVRWRLNGHRSPIGYG